MDGCSLQVFVTTPDVGRELVPSTSNTQTLVIPRHAEGFSSIGVMVV